MSNTSCPFCTLGSEKILLETDNWYLFYDHYPVSKGHLLMIPKEHRENIFECSDVELEEFWSTVNKAKDYLEGNYNPDGYNIGINTNESAGQTVFHAHVHLIPRYVGDVEDPRGGVRGVIPGKQKY